MYSSEPQDEQPQVSEMPMAPRNSSNDSVSTSAIPVAKFGSKHIRQSQVNEGRIELACTCLYTFRFAVFGRRVNLNFAVDQGINSSS